MSIGIAERILYWMQTLDSCAACDIILFGPTEGTTLGILDNGGPPGGDRTGRCHQRLTMEALVLLSKIENRELAPESRADA